MKRFQKLIQIGLMFSIVFMMFSIGGDVFAQNVSGVPTLLPQDDTDIGGLGGACIGLASRIQQGDIHLEQLPCFVKFFTQTLASVAGSLAVIFVMIGGYRYVIGRDEEKDKAKRTITYALIGLAVSLMAWIIVDLVLQVATE